MTAGRYIGLTQFSSKRMKAVLVASWLFFALLALPTVRQVSCDVHKDYDGFYDDTRNEENIPGMRDDFRDVDELRDADNSDDDSHLNDDLDEDSPAHEEFDDDMENSFSDFSDANGNIEDPGNHGKNNDKNKDLCLTPACVAAAANILSTMNTSTDPCNDFYNYACGKFQDSYEPFEDVKRSMSFEIRRRKNSFDVNRILAKMSDNNELESLNKLKVSFDSCTNENYMEKHGLTAVRKVISQYGPWPLDGQSWNKKTWNFKKTLIKTASNLPTHAFVLISVELDEKNPDSHAFKIRQPNLHLSGNNYISKHSRAVKVRRAYFKMMLNIMKLFGYSSHNLKQSMEKVFNFEVQLAKILLPKYKQRQTDKLYKKITIDSLAALNPEIDWRTWIKNLVKSVNYNIGDVKHVIVIGDKYIKEMGQLIARTDKEVLANYMLWGVVHSLQNFAGKKFIDTSFTFEKLYYGRKAPVPRWLYCINIHAKLMIFAVGRIYIDHNFKSKYAKKEVSDIISGLKGSFVENLKNVKWMDDITRRKAKSKALAILQLTAYPEFIHNNTALDEKYASLVIRKDDFLGNYLRQLSDLSKQSLLRLMQKRDRTRWGISPFVVNAFYSSVDNSIVFPAGILQPLFYHHNYPPALKFGGIGTVIGHELTHAFDDHGRKFDKTGRMIQWWADSTIKKFKKVADCIRKQYSSYKIYGRHLNGRLSCGENMADNGGLKLAYLAFKKSIKKKQQAMKRLPGLQHLSHDQLFYIAFAKIWCVIESKAMSIQGLATDPHSNPKFRVRGAVSNSVEFADAFRCKPGSPMNPLKKCEVW